MGGPPPINHLFKFRLNARLTQGQLARKAGLTIGTVSYIERGERFPQQKTQEKIAAVFHVQPDVVFFMPRPCPSLPISSTKSSRQIISCRRCHKPITGLLWCPELYELIIKAMPRPAQVHTNGFFYHTDCLEERTAVHIAFPLLNKK